MRNVQRGERRDQTQGEITMKGEECLLIRIRTRRKWIICEKCQHFESVCYPRQYVSYTSTTFASFVIQTSCTK